MFTVGIRPEESGVGITRKVLHQDVLVWNTFSSWLWKPQSWEQSRISRIRHMKDTSLQWKDKGLKLGLNFDDMNNTLKVLVKRHLQPAFQYAPRLGKVESRFFFLLLHPSRCESASSSLGLTPIVSWRVFPPNSHPSGICEGDLVLKGVISDGIKLRWDHRRL